MTLDHDLGSSETIQGGGVDLRPLGKAEQVSPIAAGGSTAAVP